HAPHHALLGRRRRADEKQHDRECTRPDHAWSSANDEAAAAALTTLRPNRCGAIIATDADSLHSLRTGAAWARRVSRLVPLAGFRGSRRSHSSAIASLC